MAVRRMIQVAVLITTLFMLGAPQAFAEERNFVGVLIKVDIENQQIELAGNVLLQISESSRFFDRAAEQVELSAFAKSASSSAGQGDQPLTLTYYKAKANEEGKLILNWISLAGPVQE
jgi:hypothetical protein